LFFYLLGAKIAIKFQFPKEKNKNAGNLKVFLVESAKNLKGIYLIHAENLNIYQSISFARLTESAIFSINV